MNIEEILKEYFTVDPENLKKEYVHIVDDKNYKGEDIRIEVFRFYPDTHQLIRGNFIDINYTIYTLFDDSEGGERSEGTNFEFLNEVQEHFQHQYDVEIRELEAASIFKQ